MPSPKRDRNPDGLNQAGTRQGVKEQFGTKPITKEGRKRGARVAQKAADIATVRKIGMDTSVKGNAELIDPDKPLTEMMQTFAKAMAQGETVFTATRKAGYASEGIGYRLIRMPNVQLAIDAEKKKFEEQAGMSRKKVLEGLQEAIEIAKMLGEPSTMVQGWKTIGQMCGYFEPVKVKHEVSVTGQVAVDKMNRMSDEDLMKFIEEQMQTMKSLPQPTPDITDVEVKGDSDA